MEKMKMETSNISLENLKKLKEMFPDVFTETVGEDNEITTAIDAKKLEQLTSTKVIEGKECYDFTWVGKRKAMIEYGKPIRKTLRPCKEDSVNYDKTENLYIEGDNLDVLKLLQNNYLNKVKMIYIDPPYNTGKDFIYNDNFAMDKDEYEKELNLRNEEGMKNFNENNTSNPRFHSDWCSMMYPRLKLARNLLTDDGVIFISIDDNEVDNLRKICNEVFGESNFIACLTWTTKKAAQGMATEHLIVKNHEYIFCYAKNCKNFKFIGLKRNEENGFSNPDNDPRGLWKRQYPQRIGQGLPIRTIKDPETGNIFSFETPYTQENLDKWVADNRFIFPKYPNKYPILKEFLSEYENNQQLVTYLGLYATKSTTEYLYKLFDNVKIFTNPKPDNLIHFLVSQMSNDSIILDFFSGSATTAHAVMQLNAEDGGNRKFIMVQLPEECDKKSEAFKAGYKNICEIGKERIRRAGKKIVEETGKTDLDIGFRVLKLDESNMKDVYFSPSEYNQDMLESLTGNIKEDRTPEDLLYSCMLEWGLELNLPIETKNIDGCNVHIVNGNELVACFDENVSEEVIKKIADLDPVRIVFRDSSFASDDAKINVTQIFKQKCSNMNVENSIKVL